MNRPKLWTKDFFLISLANFFLYFTFYLLMVSIPLFATERFQASPSIAGIASSIFIVGMLITRLFAGRYIDQLGWKRMLFLGYILFILSTAFYFLVQQLGVLLLNRLLNGAAMGIASTATGTIAASLVPEESRGEGIGYYALSTTVSSALGPFLGILITEHASFSLNISACILLLLCGFVFLFVIQVPKHEWQEPPEACSGFSLYNFFERKSIPVASVSGLMSFAYSSILVYLSSFVKELHLVQAGSLFFVVYAISILISRPFTGRLFDKRGENKVIFPAIVVFFLWLFLLGRVNSAFFLLAVAVLVGVGYGSITSSLQALAIKVAPSHHIGLATSTNFIFADLGAGVGPFLLGYLVSGIGFRGLYLTMSLVFLGGILLYYVQHGRKAMLHQKQMLEEKQPLLK